MPAAAASVSLVQQMPWASGGWSTTTERASIRTVPSAGADKVVLGTDYPFDMAEYNPIGHVAGIQGIDEATIAQLTGGNAVRVLGLDV